MIFFQKILMEKIKEETREEHLTSKKRIDRLEEKSRNQDTLIKATENKNLKMEKEQSVLHEDIQCSKKELKKQRKYRIKVAFVHTFVLFCPILVHFTTLLMFRLLTPVTSLPHV